MPPKKKGDGDQPSKTILGRMGTNLKVAIVGLPNVGKSTFFNVITKSQASAENFPFCTIDPNESRCPVPDPRFDFLCEHHKPMSKVPAFLNIVDVAGLVMGAHEGQGLGNSFLSNISACDAIFHMCRLFESEEVTHVEGDVNTVRDLGIIFEELRLKDSEYLMKLWEPLEKLCARGLADKNKKLEFEVLSKCKVLLIDEKKPVRAGLWTDGKEIDVLNQHLFLTAKPMVYLLNMSEGHYQKKKDKWLPKVKAWVDENDPGATVIPFSAELELKIFDMPQDEREKYLQATNSTSALSKIITTGYKALNLEYFFTAGKDEVRAWTIKHQTKSPAAAGRIHTDMEKGFIMAEVMHYEDFVEAGSEADAKAAGKYRQQGREYVVHDGDIIFFKFNAGAGLTAKKK